MRQQGLERLCLFSALALTTAACHGDQLPGCRVASIVDLPNTPLTGLARTRLDRVGDGFVLFGTDDEGTTVRFAKINETGQLGPETTLAVPPHRIGPYYAVTGKTAPGDQLLVIYGATDPSSSDRIAFQVVTMDAGATTPSAAKALLDGQGQAIALPATTDLQKFRANFGTSKTGQRAAFTWGLSSDTEPNLLLVRADGVTSAPTNNFTKALSGNWDCPAIVSSRSDFALSTVNPAQAGSNDHATWYLSEMGDDGQSSFTFHTMVRTQEMGCPSVAVTSKGYALAWQTVNGTYFAYVDLTQTPIFVQTDIVKGAVRFGGTVQPTVGCIAPVGKDFSLLYDAESGPLVDRFTIFGNPSGSSLLLPSHGHTAGLSAWAAPDGIFVSYLDRAAGVAGADARHFAKIDCPTQQ